MSKQPRPRTLNSERGGPRITGESWRYFSILQFGKRAFSWADSAGGDLRPKHVQTLEFFESKQVHQSFISDVLAVPQTELFQVSQVIEVF